MVDLDGIGGIPVSFFCFSTIYSMGLSPIMWYGCLQVVMKELLEGGLINGGCLTVTGNTVAENLSSVPCVSDLETQACVTIIHACMKLKPEFALLYIIIIGCTFLAEISYGSCWVSHGNSAGRHDLCTGHMAYFIVI